MRPALYGTGVETRKRWSYKDFVFPVLACLTLGLLPYDGPHLWLKIRWVLGGAKDMQAIDMLDLFIHGLPWVWLGGLIIAWARDRRRQPT